MHGTVTMSTRVAGFGTTIFSEINALAREHQAINLGQGAPDFDAPDALIAAAQQALNNGLNQYAPGTGMPRVREAVARHAARFYEQHIDPMEVVITAGATEAVFAAILGLCDPGDEVIVFQPFYDSYVPNMLMAGVIPRYLTLRAPEWTFDETDLRACFSDKTRAIIVNTPHNPTGKVFTYAELSLIAELCQQYNVIAITDEVYEHITYGKARHIRLQTLPGMEERTLAISSLGKTFSCTGWKIGWAIGARPLVDSVNRAHQFITYAVAAPLQAAAEAALEFPDSYFNELQATYQRKQDYLLGVLREAGFTAQASDGGYFIMADYRQVAPHIHNASDFAKWLITERGVACIPPTAFYRPEDRGQAEYLARFAICKQDSTLQAAAERLWR